MPTLNLAYIAELVFKYVRKIAYLLLLSSFWLAISTMWASFVTAFLYFYNKTQDVLNMIGTSGSGYSDLLDKMFGFLHCIGVLDAFRDSEPVILSAITFLFARILFNVTLKSWRYFIDSVKPLVN
jgi:hypothetical protein